MKASIVEMEGILRGKCFPAKMLVNESLAEYLVRQFDSLHERAEAAEREHNEPRKVLQETQVGLVDAINNASQLQAELSRRDAAAGEASDRIVDDGDGQKIGGIGVSDRLNCLWPIGTKFYTAAPPAVLPPEVTEPVGEYCLDDREGLAWLAGANWMRQQCLELGAQQQKVVELPTPYDIGKGDRSYYDITGWHFDREELIAALGAAGVKWEVKK